MLSIGTDCSGMDAPIQALLNLKVPFTHVFSCDNDPWCKQTILANFCPQKYFDDITSRNIRNVPYVDLYVCGFPCQPFSSAGHRMGAHDIRGSIVAYCIEYIRTKRPKYFVLENVKGLLSIHGGQLFKLILSELSSIRGYTIAYKVLNTNDFGIPQNRERVFIIGSRVSSVDFTQVQKYRKKPKKLLSFVDHTDTISERTRRSPSFASMLTNVPSNSLFINIGFRQNKYSQSGVICPCITSGNLWCVPYRRKANVVEYLKLQGFPRSFKQVVSDTQMKKQIGNSISVNVLEAIFKMVLQL